MTRKQALLQGILILSSNKKNNEIVQKLKEIYDVMPFTHWDRESIFDAVEQFILDHDGKIPSVRDFQSKELPTHSSLKRIFGITVSEFLEKYYPDRMNICHSRYDGRTATELLADFKQTYYNINNGNYVQISVYDMKREDRSPTAKTLMKIFCVESYSDLIKLCDFEKKSIFQTS